MTSILSLPSIYPSYLDLSGVDLSSNLPSALCCNTSNTTRCPNIANRLIIAQLSDLHLSGLVGVNDSYHKFITLLPSVLAYRPDFLLLTGDLVNDGNKDGYDWLFDVLHQTHIPFACVAGNHDVSIEHNSHLPFEYRRLTAQSVDDRLDDCRVIDLGNWQLLLLNSSCAGKIAGKLTDKQLHWLNHTLSTNNKPSILALHHHPIKVGSHWIDSHKLQNGNELLDVIIPYTHLKGVLCGHVHQACSLPFGHSTLYTCPAIARQFLPHHHHFALDDLPCGWRLLYLSNNFYGGHFDGGIQTTVCRFYPNKPQNRGDFTQNKPYLS